MCTKITIEDFTTIHHEMGHIEYYMQYKNQPHVYREGANPGEENDRLFLKFLTFEKLNPSLFLGFHEAIGDTIALSVSTMKHKIRIGLLPNDTNTKATDFDSLFESMLEKVAFFPFAYLMDQWRWRVFNGSITEGNYNREWWNLR